MSKQSCSLDLQNWKIAQISTAQSISHFGILTSKTSMSSHRLALEASAELPIFISFTTGFFGCKKQQWCLGTFVRAQSCLNGPYFQYGWIRYMVYNGIYIYISLCKWCFVAVKTDKVLQVTTRNFQSRGSNSAYGIPYEDDGSVRSMGSTYRRHHQVIWVFQMISVTIFIPKNVEPNKLCRSVDDVCKICTLYVCNPPSTKFLKMALDCKKAAVFSKVRKGVRESNQLFWNRPCDLMKCRMRLSFGFTVYCQPTQEVCHRPQMSEHAWNDEMQIQLKASASIAFLSFCCYIVVHSKEALCFSKFAKPSWPPDPVLCRVKWSDLRWICWAWREWQLPEGSRSAELAIVASLLGVRDLSKTDQGQCIEGKDVKVRCLKDDKDVGFAKNSCIAQLEQKLRQNRTLRHHDLGVIWIFGEQYTQLGQSCKACHKNLQKPQISKLFASNSFCQP